MSSEKCIAGKYAVSLVYGQLSDTKRGYEVHIADIDGTSVAVMSLEDAKKMSRYILDKSRVLNV